MNENQPVEATKPANKPKNSGGMRQLVLIGILLLVGAAFLWDKFILLPDAEAKINKIANEVTIAISDKNRSQVEEVVDGLKPSNTFTHNGIEVVQYRFPRGIPLIIKRRAIDIAYNGDAIAMFKVDNEAPITPEDIDQRFGDKLTADNIDKTKTKEMSIQQLQSPNGS